MNYNCAIAHSVYYALVLIPGFEEKYLHGNVVAYGVLVQLLVVFLERTLIAIPLIVLFANFVL